MREFPNKMTKARRHDYAAVAVVATPWGFLRGRARYAIVCGFAQTAARRFCVTLSHKTPLVGG